MNCVWCGTRLFPEDRNCPACGGTITISDNGQTRKQYKRFITSVAKVELIQDNKIVFTGKTLLDSSMEVKLFSENPKSKYYHYRYCSSSPRFEFFVSDYKELCSCNEQGEFWCRIISTLVTETNDEIFIGDIEIKVPSCKLLEKYSDVLRLESVDVNNIFITVRTGE